MVWIGDRYQLPLPMSTLAGARLPPFPALASTQSYPNLPHVSNGREEVFSLPPLLEVSGECGFTVSPRVRREVCLSERHVCSSVWGGAKPCEY